LLKARMLLDGAAASANSDYPPSYRNNQRCVFDDESLAQRLSARVRLALGAALEFADARFVGINPRWRGCRYAAGQRFNVHQDGVYFATERVRSRLSFMIYLDDASSFSGGDTVFYASASDQSADEIARVRPALGALIVFEHSLWHAGAIVTAGTKCILRSDLLFEHCPADAAREAPALAPAQPVQHRGYVFCLAQLDARTQASGGRDCEIQLSRVNQRDACAVLRGHTQSVLKLAVLNQPPLHGVSRPTASSVVASISRDRSLRLWDWRRATSLAVLPNAFASTPLDLLWQPQSAQLLVTDAGGGVSWFSVHLAQEAATLRFLHRTVITPEGSDAQSNADAGAWLWGIARLSARCVACVSESGWLHVLAGDGLRSSSPRGEIETYLGPTPLRAIAARRTPLGVTIVCADANGWLVQLNWRAGALHVQRRWRAHTAAIRCLRFAGAQLWSGGEDNALCSWDLFGTSLDAAPVRTSYLQADAFVTDVLPGKNARIAGYFGQYPLCLAAPKPAPPPNVASAKCHPALPA
jgi:WD40 repeat protein